MPVTTQALGGVLKVRYVNGRRKKRNLSKEFLYSKTVGQLHKKSRKGGYRGTR